MRRDGATMSLNDDLANDLEELIVQLRRLPGDAGAIGFEFVDECRHVFRKAGSTSIRIEVSQPRV